MRNFPDNNKQNVYSSFRTSFYICTYKRGGTNNFITLFAAIHCMNE